MAGIVSRARESIFQVLAAMSGKAKLDAGRVTIVVELPPDRSRPGQVTVRDEQGRVVGGPYPAYGRADSSAAQQAGNPTRDPKRRNGDTPDGEYRAVIAVATGSGTNYNARSYGTTGALVLDPTSGDAKTAKDNGRTGLMMHGGDPRTGGGLRATHGCIRLSNDHMAAVLADLARLSYASGPPVCRAITANVQVNVGVDPVCTDNVSDPPAGIAGVIATAPPNWDPHNRAPPPHDRAPPHGRAPPHSRAPPHDREPHDREPHDREPHEREPPHQREPPHVRQPPHDREPPHQREPHEREPPHQREPHDREPHDREPHNRLA